MPLSAAERCRRYREKLKQTNPAKFEELKKKNAERTKANKRKIEDMSQEEKQIKRKQWRDAKRTKKGNNEVLPQAANPVDIKRRKYRSKLLRENNNLKEGNKCLLVKNANLQKTVIRYKRTINNLTNRLNTITKQSNEETIPQTPITPITKFIEEKKSYISEESKEKVRKKLLETRVLEETLKETYKSSKPFEKRVLKKIVQSELVKKHKMQNNIRKCLGLIRGIRHYHSVKQRKVRTSKEIATFFKRGDISRMGAGKKECITRNKIKKQKRILLNTLSNLYKVYRNEGGTLSFATFKRYRPFYVVPPHVSNRNTCACIKHANLNFKAQTLRKAGLISSTDPNDLLSEVVCDIKSKSCMYSECAVCADKIISFTTTEDVLSQEVTWTEWTTTSYEYEKSGVRKTTKKTGQEEKTGSFNTLIIKFQEDLAKFKTHFYNIYHQHKQYKEAIEKIHDNVVVIHCDFSENYGCKMAEEVQSMHFAGSRQQITLHTGVFYIKNEKPVSFCSISPSLKHDPQAIWGHLGRVIEFVKEKFPNINCVHYFSDGPTTQYRQKKFFWLFSEKTKEAGFVQATWSFFEASHGKGAADGVGGTIKRTLDRKVAYGENIVNALSAFETLSKTETSVKLFYVPENIIQKIQVPENIQPVPNTMKVHQIVGTEDKHIIKYRPLSCFCARGNCQCFSLKTHDFNLKYKKTKKNETEDHTENTKNIKMSKNKKTKAKSNMKKIKKVSASTSEDTDSNDIQYDDDSDDDCSYTSDGTEALKEMENTHSKVTVLSEIRNTEENVAYFDLTKYGPVSLKPMLSDIDLFSQNLKENIRQNVNPFPRSLKDEHESIIDEQVAIPEISEGEEVFELHDTILVRYLQRKNWKYYIGFIDKIERKDDNIFYTVRFLKSIQINNNIKFIIPKKKDIDIITNISIVKKIKIHLEQAGEYCLTDNGDEIYFY